MRYSFFGAWPSIFHSIACCVAHLYRISKASFAGFENNITRPCFITSILDDFIKQGYFMLFPVNYWTKQACFIQFPARHNVKQFCFAFLDKQYLCAKSDLISKLLKYNTKVQVCDATAV
jgi:hypothetical protein